MVNGTTKVLCSCSHHQQDEMYGKGIRVANATAKQDKDFVEVRCTVCSKIHRVHPSKVR